MFCFAGGMLRYYLRATRRCYQAPRSVTLETPEPFQSVLNIREYCRSWVLIGPPLTSLSALTLCSSSELLRNQVRSDSKRGPARPIPVCSATFAPPPSQFRQKVHHVGSMTSVLKKKNLFGLDLNKIPQNVSYFRFFFSILVKI